MTDTIYKNQVELAKILEKYSEHDGAHVTTIPSLFFLRRSNVTDLSHSVYNPCICIIVQGAKELFLAQECFRYGPSDYLLASVNLPVSGQVTEASPDVPYLALKLEFTPSQILEVIREFKIQGIKKENAKRGMYVSPIDSSMLDAVLRLTRLLENPDDIPILAPLYMKEILYRVLQGPHGRSVEQIAIEGSSTYLIRDVIEQIINNYDRSIRIEDLAQKANMSVSTLHRHFKVVTAMSPIQFQKQLRLQKARQLLFTESKDAADVAFTVGYESPSQFSREYSRMFGLPPIEDINRLKATYI
ncbi:AraC family transcriptional regulator [Bacillus sp. UMB0899]|nr:AraC family transcriptional regulator [Bacillus sp. UMB0899]